MIRYAETSVKAGAAGVLDCPTGACHRARRRRDPVAGHGNGAKKSAGENLRRIVVVA